MAEKYCTLYTVLDIVGLKNFYGQSPLAPIYDADSYYNLICDEAPFDGPTNKVLLFEQGINYIWQMNDLQNLSPSSKGTLPKILSFEFTWLGKDPVAWNKVFELDGWQQSGHKLVCTKFNQAAATIKTKSDLFKAVPNLRLSYSITFQFKLCGNKVIGRIDPLIKNRTDD